MAGTLGTLKRARREYERAMTQGGFAIEGASMSGSSHVMLTLRHVETGKTFEHGVANTPSDGKRNAMNAVRDAKRHLRVLVERGRR